MSLLANAPPWPPAYCSSWPFSHKRDFRSTALGAASGGRKAGKSAVVIVMKWDGKNVNGMINPGPNVVRFSGPVLEPSDWTVHIEAQSRDGQPIVIDAKLDDIGSYNRTLTGTWKQAGVDHPFKMARE